MRDPVSDGQYLTNDLRLPSDLHTCVHTNAHINGRMKELEQKTWFSILGLTFDYYVLSIMVSYYHERAV